MTRLLAACIAAVAVFALPAGALAKEAEKAKVCGASGCQMQTSEKEKQAIVAAFENGGPPTTPPNRHVPFYRVSVYIKGMPKSEPPFRLLVAPSVRRVRGDDNSWFAMDAIALRAWRRVTRDIKPFPAAKLPGVDPNAPRPVIGGQLPPKTYAPALQAPVATDNGGTAWGLIAGIAAGSLALLAAMTLLVTRRRRRGGGPQAAPVS